MKKKPTKKTTSPAKLKRQRQEKRDHAYLNAVENELRLQRDIIEGQRQTMLSQCCKIQELTEALKNTPEEICEACNGDGWLLIFNTDTLKKEIQRCDACERFDGDESAIKHIAALAHQHCKRSGKKARQQKKQKALTETLNP